MSDTGESPRITDPYVIDAENFKFRNTRFLNSDAKYDILDHETPQRVRHRIWVTRNGDLRRVLSDFPTDDRICEQCAGWMHAVAGRHFFPDANHRTAVVLLRRLLRENGITPGTWPADRTRETVIRSHRVRAEIDNVRLDTLYRRDRLFLVWLLYFKCVLRVPEQTRP
ncbi:MAG: hypothetical protein ABEJ86_00850 [Halococcoides sp.]